MTKTLILNIKDLKISSPSIVGSMTLKLKSNVIVVAKFDFSAESPQELSVHKGDVLKLLDRLPNGWVLVKFVDRVQAPGLVPCLYVDIAVNDPQNPITVQWLHQDASGSGSTFVDAQVQSLLAKNAPLTFNNRPYPITVVVSHYLTYENRFWYRVDVTYSTGDQGYLCRYYQDFYDLHAQMLDNVLSGGAGEPAGKLPKLPEPVPSSHRSSEEQQEIFSRRCRQLSTYMTELINDKTRQVAPTTLDWLDCAYQGRPGFVVEETLNDAHEVISQRVLPGSVTLASECRLERVKSTSKPSPKPDVSKFSVPSGSELQRVKTKNIYNHYQQAASFSKGQVGRSASGRAPGRSSSQRKPSSDSGLPGHNTLTEQATYTSEWQTKRTSPQLERVSKAEASLASPPISPASATTSPQIKCKIKTPSGDIIVIKLAKAQIGSVEDFKMLIYNKVAFNNLFIKFPQSDSFQEIESVERDAMTLLHAVDRVLLLVT